MEGAVGAAGRECSVGILQAIITFLSGIHRGVSTGRAEEAAGGRVAAVGKIGVVKPRFTDFVEGLLDDAVTADAAFEETEGRAAVTVSTIAVVAFLGGGEDAVAADGSAEDSGGKGAGEGTEGAGRVALFGGDSHAVAADSSCCEMGGFKGAGGAAAIPSPGVGVITGFGGGEDAVTAESGGGNEGVFRKTGGGAAVS